MLSRISERFPTRNYPYSRMSAEAEGEASTPAAGLQTNTLYRFVVGLDTHPRPMTGEEKEALGDPFARLLLLRGVFPLSLRALLTELSRFDADEAGLPQQRIFLAADGGQIPWSQETDDLARAFRIAVARGRGDDFRILISSSTVADSEKDRHFLQLIGWDEDHGVFNYYERRGGTWAWAGSSLHALAAETRGQGPFDSHVNGSLVMKELRQPWVHWHSPAAGIAAEALAPEDPFRDDPLFLSRVTADRLETTIVRPGIQRWNRARLRRALEEDGTWNDVLSFLRQVLETTTVNLVTADQVSRLIEDTVQLTLPITFFLNTEALLDTAGLEPDIERIRVPGRLYRASLERFGFYVTDGRHRFAGDTHFAFLVPEPAFEDTDVLALLVGEGLLSQRFAACLQMIDFPNPVFSPRRAALLAYVPATARVLRQDGQVRSDLEERFVAAVEAAVSGTPEGSPERELLAYWALGEVAWRARFEEFLTEYFAALAERAATEEGFDDFVRLAESRRRGFRRRRLDEFKLTVPRTNIPDDAPALRMRADGHVEPL
jgi:hypothetical protein